MKLLANPKAVIDGYFSHPIRGAKGNAATPAEMEANCKKCRIVAHDLVRRFPKMDLYVPADHDEFVSDAFQSGILTDVQILEVDCMIVKKRKFLIAYDPFDHISSGMRIEIDFAHENHIPVFELTKNCAGQRKRFGKFLELLLETK